MDTIRNFHGRLIALMAFLALFVGGLTLIAYGGGSASAGGGGEEKVPAGKALSEGWFHVNVEPIKVEYNVRKGYLPLMHPGDHAVVEVTATNTSKHLEWGVRLDITPDLSGGSYRGRVMEIEARWGDGRMFKPDEVQVLAPGQIRTLAIAVNALDAVGDEDLIIRPYSVPPPVVSYADPSSATVGIAKHRPG